MDSKIISEIMDITGFKNFDVVEHHPKVNFDFVTESYHDGSAGISRYDAWVFALAPDGALTRLVAGSIWDSNYAYSQRREIEATSIMEQVAALDFIPEAIIVASYELEDWPGQEYISEHALTYYAWQDPDYTKIRRRVEDFLRKTSDNELLLQVAGLCGVKLT